MEILLIVAAVTAAGALASLAFSVENKLASMALSLAQIANTLGGISAQLSELREATRARGPKP